LFRRLSLLLIATLLAPSLQAGPSSDLTVCVNYSCRSQKHIRLKSSQWRGLTQLFAHSRKNPERERKAIGKAIGKIETLVGARVGTATDQPRNEATGEPGQLDCIAESRNTEHYLRLLQARGLIRQHRVLERVKRAPLLFDSHWSAVIEEKATGQRYAVDSWFRANGQAAVVMPLKDWFAKREADYLRASGR
jgi:hypothetical protein